MGFISDTLSLLNKDCVESSYQLFDLSPTTLKTNAARVPHVALSGVPSWLHFSRTVCVVAPGKPIRHATSIGWKQHESRSRTTE